MEYNLKVLNPTHYGHNHWYYVAPNFEESLYLVSIKSEFLVAWLYRTQKLQVLGCKGGGFSKSGASWRSG